MPRDLICLVDGPRAALHGWAARRARGGVAICILSAMEVAGVYGPHSVCIALPSDGSGVSDSLLPPALGEELDRCRDLCAGLGIPILDSGTLESIAGSLVAGGYECVVVTDRFIHLEPGQGVRVVGFDGVETVQEGWLPPGGVDIPELVGSYVGARAARTLLSDVPAFSRLPFEISTHFLWSLLAGKWGREEFSDADLVENCMPSEFSDSHLVRNWSGAEFSDNDVAEKWDGLLAELRSERFALHAVEVDGGLELAFATSAGVDIVPVRCGEGECLAGVLGDPGCCGYVHDLKGVGRMLEGVGLPDDALQFDVALAGYLLDPDTKKYSVEDLSYEWLGLKLGSSDPAVVARLLRELGERLRTHVEDKDMGSILEGVEVPLARVLRTMEAVGVGVDPGRLETFRQEVEVTREQVRKEVWKIAGWHLNQDRDRDVSKYLYGKLGLESGRIGRSGTYSTDKDELQRLYDEHDVIPPLQEYRELSDILSDVTSYLQGEADGRIYSTFNQTRTVTGRVSTTEPNLQGVPGNSPLATKLREVFVPAPGYVLVSADYSQIDLRVLAHLSGDERLLQAFQAGEDIHAATAKDVLKDLPEDEGRRIAKEINFLVIYGGGPSLLRTKARIEYTEARNYLGRWKRRYKGVLAYGKEVLQEARETGEVVTLLGRRLPVRSLDRAGQRKAVNHVVQGSSADIMKLAMLHLDRKLQEWDARMVLVIHDELLFEVAENQVDDVVGIIKKTMEGAWDLESGLEVKVKVGGTWGELEK